MILKERQEGICHNAQLYNLFIKKVHIVICYFNQLDMIDTLYAICCAVLSWADQNRTMYYDDDDDDCDCDCDYDDYYETQWTHYFYFIFNLFCLFRCNWLRLSFHFNLQIFKFYFFFNIKGTMISFSDVLLLYANQTGGGGGGVDGG